MDHLFGIMWYISRFYLSSHPGAIRLDFNNKIFATRKGEVGKGRGDDGERDRDDRRPKKSLRFF